MLCSSSAAFADVDGDDALDIIIGNAGSNTGIEIWINEVTDTGAFSKQQVINLRYNFDVALGDLNNDGHDDIFVANGYSMGDVQPNHVWLNNGAGVFTDTMQALGSAASQGVALGDYDLDGDLDALVANGTYDQGLPDKVWINDGMGVFTESGQSFPVEYSLHVASGDLNDDGDIDIFTATYQADRVWINTTNDFQLYLPVVRR